MKTRRNLYIDDKIWEAAEKLSHKMTGEGKKTNITNVFTMAICEFLEKHGFGVKREKPEKPPPKKDPIKIDELNIGNNKYIFYENGFVNSDGKMENFHQIIKYFPENHPVRKRVEKLYFK